MTIRLAEVAGPLLQVCCAAVLTCPVSGTLGESCVQVPCPAELAHCTSNANAFAPDDSWNAPPAPVPDAVTLYPLVAVSAYRQTLWLRAASIPRLPTVPKSTSASLVIRTLLLAPGAGPAASRRRRAARA